jgi:hypothetical protein
MTYPRSLLVIFLLLRASLPSVLRAEVARGPDNLAGQFLANLRRCPYYRRLSSHRGTTAINHRDVPKATQHRGGRICLDPGHPGRPDRVRLSALGQGVLTVTQHVLAVFVFEGCRIRPRGVYLDDFVMCGPARACNRRCREEGRSLLCILCGSHNDSDRTRAVPNLQDEYNRGSSQ